jgi:orotidine-5'-phosphate decarboxylase
VGLVVGATAPLELERIRIIAPAVAMLVPGVGAQGGEVDPVLRHGPAVAPPAGGRPGGGLLVNVSRGISAAALSPGAADIGDRLADAAAVWSQRLRVAPDRRQVGALPPPISALD